MKNVPSPLLMWLALTAAGCATAQPDIPPTDLRARYLIAVVNDFVVDVYHNGSPVPDKKRTLLKDHYGATVERIDHEVVKGDWLVFNVVNNRLRWGGACYFGVAGVVTAGKFGFVTELDSGSWSVCDDPAEVPRFISVKEHLAANAPREIDKVWRDGTGLMKQFAGSSWPGTPLWGAKRNTWVKVIVQ